MWAITLAYILLRLFSALGQTATNLTKVENKTVSTAKLQTEVGDMTKQLDVSPSFLDEMEDGVSSVTEFLKPWMVKEMGATEEGRRLKYKRAELKFIMKTLLLLKIVLGLVLPIGIIASKILSWKAVTLSLMAFMLAKILFMKNLLSGKNAFSVTPTNFVPPVFIHGGPNELFWKRQGDVQNAYPWNSS